MTFPTALSASLADILYLFIREKYAANPKLFGLESYRREELIENSFDMIGDECFCLYEKQYRLNKPNADIGLKVYFKNGKFKSTGIDAGGERLCTTLNSLKTKTPASEAINTIELLITDDNEGGSLIINNSININFGILGGHKSQMKFHLLGINTDYDATTDSIEEHAETSWSREIKISHSFYKAKKKFKKNSAIQELTAFMINSFPEKLVS